MPVSLQTYNTGYHPVKSFTSTEGGAIYAIIVSGIRNLKSKIIQWLKTIKNKCGNTI